MSSIFISGRNWYAVICPWNISSCSCSFFIKERVRGVVRSYLLLISAALYWRVPSAPALQREKHQPLLTGVCNTRTFPLLVFCSMAQDQSSLLLKKQLNGESRCTSEGSFLPCSRIWNGEKYFFINHIRLFKSDVVFLSYVQTRVNSLALTFKRAFIFALVIFSFSLFLLY